MRQKKLFYMILLIIISFSMGMNIEKQQAKRIMLNSVYTSLEYAMDSWIQYQKDNNIDNYNKGMIYFNTAASSCHFYNVFVSKNILPYNSMLIIISVLNKGKEPESEYLERLIEAIEQLLSFKKYGVDKAAMNFSVAPLIQNVSHMY